MFMGTSDAKSNGKADQKVQQKLLIRDFRSNHEKVYDPELTTSFPSWDIFLWEARISWRKNSRIGKIEDAPRDMCSFPVLQEQSGLSVLVCMLSKNGEFSYEVTCQMSQAFYDLNFLGEVRPRLASCKGRCESGFYDFQNTESPWRSQGSQRHQREW